MKITLGRYLWERIREVGTRSIMGVPGDFNLQLLDYIFEVEGLKWVGNQNELNAAYAADGYARVKGAPGCFVTTHGVGELSAMNGVAGSNAEHVKVIHVVGQTLRMMQKNHMMIHHNMGERPDHQVHNKSALHVRVDAAELWDTEKAPAEIDRVIRECILQSHPVYIFIPLDMVWEEVPANLLNTKIDLTPPVDEEAEKNAVDSIKKALGEAKTPALFVDGVTRQHGALEAARELADVIKIPTFSSAWGKSIIDESEPYWVGMYNGKVNRPGVKEVMEQSDIVLVLGNFPSDLNTGSFTRGFDQKSTIYINEYDVEIKGRKLSGTHIKSLIERLATAMAGTALSRRTCAAIPPWPPLAEADSTTLTQDWMWCRFASFLRPYDVILADIGTAPFGVLQNTVPAHTHVIAQVYWGSIGYAVPAALGSELALDELHHETGRPRGRTVLLTGDGSLALTMQEIATMIAKDGVKPLIFVINNHGYAVERLIHGEEAPYNDIPPNKYAHLLPLYNHPDSAGAFRRVETKAEFDKVLQLPALQGDSDNVQMVELMLEKMDMPWMIKEMARLRPGA
ncbi:thiamine diphosphate-binding protein [Lineolata rhizophorae]|uniref:Pyruvate decarboxylase n=1 Tax=Lineolata rhizophorae TaxID=578093 RepID=A0A6A6NWK9_9PEZI|nr:thiamine diphosphate-binding protein [Lineolata rhizophorae]